MTPAARLLEAAEMADADAEMHIDAAGRFTAKADEALAHARALREDAIACRDAAARLQVAEPRAEA